MSPALELVKEIIEKFGPRKAGSKAENLAQDYLIEKLSAFCNKVEKQTFSVSLGAKFGSLKIFCVLYAVSVSLVYFDFRAALLLSSFNAILFFLHFNSYRHILDFLFSLQNSSNVIGTIEPELEAKRTLIFSGHMDSTPEFIWWYRLKDWGVRIMIVVGFAFVLLPIFIGILIFTDQTIFTNWILGINSFFLICIPLSSVYFFIHGKLVVDGAQDNLSGIAIAYEAAKSLQLGGKSLLKHTRIKMISFGSEETGLRGSHDYVSNNYKLLKEENSTLINLDGILDIANLFILKSEPSPMIKYKKEIINELKMSFDACKIKARIGVLPVGATDGASFARKKLNAVSLIGLPLNGLHPTYHTRLDTHHHLNGNTLNSVVNVLVRMAMDADIKIREEQKSI